MKRFLLGGLFLLLTAGCSYNSTFVYKPSAFAAGGQKLPVKVAVVAFVDGTEDFTKRGSELFDQKNTVYNLAKGGWGGVMTALTPELWAKALADELAASGPFGSVRFVYTPAEAADEEIRIEGIVEKASLSGTFVGPPNEFVLELRAFRRTDVHPVWEKKISRNWVINDRNTLYAGCGGDFDFQCAVYRHHADSNRVMQDIFAEARTDLVRTLASPGDRSGLSATSPETPSAGEAVDREIERILKGN
jgi:hypothetical protein